MLDVRRLRVLREVARHGSLSAAAAALGYTQPAVSRQISVLEGEVGMQLLRRQPQGVTLTEAGRLLVARTDELLAALSRTEEELRAQADLEGGTLRMSVFASAAASVAPPALARFRGRHPGVELIVTVADPLDSLPLLRGGELDLALCNSVDPSSAESATRRSPDSGGLRLEHVPLFDDPMYVALPADHPLADAATLPLASLGDESWMLATRDSCPDAELFLDACAAAGIEPNVAFQFDDYAALLGFVAAGVGISVVPDMVARAAREDVVVRTPDPPLPARRISAAVPAGYRSPAVSAMLDTLLELAPEWVAGRLDTAQALRRDPALTR
ncbi:MAG TPA: LysR family transcriptional regulator [Solirubrobacteraceae bacterium]|nr:LysR family transcriptional regulator [Solirubrobacteraceae bacterium]